MVCFIKIIEKEKYMVETWSYTFIFLIGKIINTYLFARAYMLGLLFKHT